jgi:hypothetical protein
VNVPPAIPAFRSLPAHGWSAVPSTSLSASMGPRNPPIPSFPTRHILRTVPVTRHYLSVNVISHNC